MARKRGSSLQRNRASRYCAHRWSALLTAALLLAGCAALPGPGPSAVPARTKVLSGVPFYPQEKYQCGPASLAAVLNYYRQAPDPEAIAEAVYDPKRRGTLSLDLVLYAREIGFQARWYAGDTADLVSSIDAGRPLLVLVDLGAGPVRRPHFMVLIGYSPEGVIAHSGKKAAASIAWPVFLSQWERSEFWTMTASAPPESDR